MTAARQEHKLLLPRADAQQLLALLDAHLSRHRFEGPGANSLPGAQHFTTTLYFDTPSHAVLRQALASPEDNTKLRAREYYDRHPDLLETATDAADLDVYQPTLWLELKARLGAHTSKQRVGIPKADVVPILEAAAAAGLDSERVRVEPGPMPPSVVAAALQDFLGAATEPFSVSCAVHYRRIAWQDAAGTVRVTLDMELSVFPGDPALLQRQAPLVREQLGAPAFVSQDVIAEVKLRCEPPAWLAGWLAGHDRQRLPGGKFLLAGRKLYPEIVAQALPADSGGQGGEGSP